MNPIRFIAFMILGLVLGTYLAFTEWLDARKDTTDGEGAQ